MWCFESHSRRNRAGLLAGYGFVNYCQFLLALRSAVFIVMRSIWRSFSGRGRRFHDNHSPYVQEGGLEKVFVKYVPLTGGLLIGDQASA